MTATLVESPQQTKHRDTTLIYGPYQISVIQTLSEFDSLYNQWDRFLKESGIYNLCLTHGWLKTWLSHFPSAEPLIILVQDAYGQWVGIAPLQIKSNPKVLTHRLLKAIEWIGSNPTVFDWMQFIIHPQADEDAVITAIADGLRQTKWDVLDLQFCINQQHLELFVEALGIGSSSDIQATSPIPYLEVPPTKEEYEQIRRKKTRLEVNRHRNRIFKDFGQSPQLKFLQANPATNSSLLRFYNGHINYWSDRGQVSNFQRHPALCQFYMDMLAYSQTHSQPGDPQLQFSILYANEYELSYHLGFWQGNGYLAHISSFNQEYKDYSPGTIHMDQLVFETINRRGIEFETGNGDEPYKKMWTKAAKPLWKLCLLRNPLSTVLWKIDFLLLKLQAKFSWIKFTS